MIARLGADGAHQIPHAHGERGPVELGQHLPRGEHTYVTSVFPRRGVIGVLARQGREALAGADASQQVFRLATRRGVGCGGRVCRAHQDVPHPGQLGRGIIVDVVSIVLLDLGAAEWDGQGGNRGHNDTPIAQRRPRGEPAGACVEERPRPPFLFGVSPRHHARDQQRSGPVEAGHDTRVVVEHVVDDEPTRERRQAASQRQVRGEGIGEGGAREAAVDHPSRWNPVGFLDERHRALQPDVALAAGPRREQTLRSLPSERHAALRHDALAHVRPRLGEWLGHHAAAGGIEPGVVGEVPAVESVHFRGRRLGRSKGRGVRHGVTDPKGGTAQAVAQRCVEGLQLLLVAPFPCSGAQLLSQPRGHV